MTSPNAPGRPPLPAGTARKLRLVLRVSEAERDGFELAARAAMRTVSDWARVALVKAAAQQSAPK